MSVTPDTLVVATGNAHKLREIREILAGDGVHIVGLQTAGPVPEIIEDGDTFEANAAKKARTVALALGCWALGDDSGLEVTALNGAPGVFSARFAGPAADTAANNALLLERLAGVADRSARFRCAIALSTPAGDVDVVDGACSGRILCASRGCNGFGYDPLFVPDGHGRTFAELTAGEKHAISHRGRALVRARAAWWRNGRVTLPGVALPARHS